MKIPDRRIELFTASVTGSGNGTGTGTGTGTTPGTDSAGRFSSPATGDEKTILVAMLAAHRAN